MTFLTYSIVVLCTLSSAFAFAPLHRFTPPIARIQMAAEPDLAKLDFARNERLLTRAQKLRAEALELETEQKLQKAEQIYETFKFFDTDNSGTVSVAELREGLRKTIKLSLSEQEAVDLMREFDENADGVLQPEEFKNPEEFKKKFEAFVRRAKDEANTARMSARMEKKAAEEAEKRAEIVDDILNDRTPTVSDRAVSILPYLFPLLDATSYGQDILNQFMPNPIVAALLLSYRVYINIPLSGIVAFFALNFFSQNLQLNRLVRFNIRQAIFVDIALVIPSLLSGVVSVVLPEFGVNVPSDFNAYVSATIFLSFLTAIIYSVTSSLAGVTPDKLPYISERVNRVLPSAAQLKEMLATLENQNLTPEQKAAAEAKAKADRDNSIPKEKKDDDKN